MRKIKSFLAVLLSLVMVVTFAPVNRVGAAESVDETVGTTDTKSATPATTDPMNTTKSVVSNGDGTYKITLEVTGKVEEESHTEVSSANVIVVLDVSTSMNQSFGSGTRLAAVKTAANLLVDAMPNAASVEMAVVSFGGSVTTNVGWTTINSDSVKTSIKNSINGLTTNTGTNWTSALSTAKTLADNKKSDGDTDPTFIIFLTDGCPTTNIGQHSHGSSGTRDITDTCISDPLSTMTAMVTAGYSVYGIYANTTSASTMPYSGNSSNTTGDTDPLKYVIRVSGAAGYYNADSTDALNETFTALAQTIVNSIGYQNVEIDDGVTSLSETSASTTVSGEASGFVYTKGGETWTDAPEAKLVDGAVVWDLSSKCPLENGVTYAVSFDVWPSQTAYDIIADLNNGTITEDDLTEEQKAQIGGTAEGGYYLRTNTFLNTKYTYKETDYVYTGNAGDGGMALVSSSISIKKYWENGLDGRNATPISITVMEDNTVQKAFEKESETVDNRLVPVEQADGSYIATSGNIYIAPGVIVGQPTNGAYSDDQILEDGHDYKVVEGQNDAYYWELQADVYHPMVINGTLTLLKEDTNGTVSFKGKKYTVVNGEAVLEAHNYRRSNLNLKKVVNDKTKGEDDEAGLAPADALFGYSITVTDANAEANGNKIWFSVADENLQTVTDPITSATAETNEDGSKTGYYYGTSGRAFTVSLQAGWNLRIINLPSQSTYSIEETDMPGGFYFNKSVITDKEGNEISTESSSQTISGTIALPNESYTVTYTNDYEGFFYVYHTSKKGGDTGVIETFPVRGNEHFNIHELTADGTYYGGYYNNYYYTGTVDKTTDASNATVASGTGKVYNGQSLGFNKAKATAYTVNGEDMAPVAGQVYYLKEVPDTYLNEKIYNKQKTNDDFAVTSVSAIANVDDKNYSEYGFYFNGAKNKVASLASTFTETNNGKTTKHTGKTLFGTANTGYLVIKAFTSSIKKNGVYTVKPYWVTPDGIEVQSKVTRTIKAGDLTRDTFTVE